MRITSRFFIIFLSASLIVMLSCAAFVGWYFLDLIWENEQETIEHHFDAAGFYLNENAQRFQTAAEAQADTWPGLEQGDNALNTDSAEYFINQLDLSAQGIHFAEISDLQEQHLAGRYLNAAGEFTTIPASTLSSLNQLMRQMPAGINSTAFLAADDEIYLIAVSHLQRPNENQSVGRYILGRRMDPVIFDRLSELTRISFNMTSQWPADLSESAADAAYQTTDYSRLLDSDISAYQQLQDNPLVLLQLSLQRETYRSQLAGLGGFMFVLLAFTSILIVIVLILINQRILIPIGRFTENVSRLDFTSYKPLSFNRKASPELHLLGQTINQLMMTIRDEQEQLHRSECYLRTLFEQAPIGIVVGNLEQPIRDANPAFCRLVGRDREQLCQLRLADITYADDLQQKPAIIDRFSKGETDGYQLQKRYRRPDGSSVWAHVTAASLTDLPDRPDLNVYMVMDISRNVTQLAALRESERVKTELLQRDVLTGIYNRRYFEQALLEAEQKREFPISLMIGDINGLKLVNDAFGHQSGDTMIIQAARILQSCCRSGDILARTGGDEFILILPNTDDAAAYMLMKKIQGLCIRHNNRIRDEELHVSISLGYATRTDPGQKMTAVLEIADDYMRKHKLLEKRSSQSAIVSSILATLYERSQETEEHAQRLAALAQKIGHELDLSQLEQDQLILLARLHDIGKINISRQILNKPGKLTAQEWAEMRQHPEIGYRIAIASPQLLSIAELILTHHEHWNGRGYPQGISGEDIPLLSRIIALVDAYDVMTQNRPYRKAIGKNEALDEIRRCAGSQFDPRIAQIFIDLISETE